MLLEPFKTSVGGSLLFAPSVLRSCAKSRPLARSIPSGLALENQGGHMNKAEEKIWGEMIGIGTAIGIIFGLLLGDMAIGIAGGILLGMAIGWAEPRPNKKSRP